MKHNISLQKIQTADKIIVQCFSEEIKKTLLINLKELILFGSRARGDNHEYSDYDFIVVVFHKDKKIVRKIRNVGLYLLNQYDALIGSIVWSEKEWEEKKRYPIGYNIMKEGIWL